MKNEGMRPWEDPSIRVETETGKNHNIISRTGASACVSSHIFLHQKGFEDYIRKQWCVEA